MGGIEDRVDRRIEAFGFSLAAGTAMRLYPQLREPVINALVNIARRHGTDNVFIKIPLWFLPKGEQQKAINMMKVARHNHKLEEKGGQTNG